VKHPAWAAAINSSGLVPFSFSKAGPEGVGGFGEDVGIGGKIAGAGATGPAPNRFRFADHVTSPFYVPSELSRISSFVAFTPRDGRPAHSTMVSTDSFRKRLPVVADRDCCRHAHKERRRDDQRGAQAEQERVFLPDQRAEQRDTGCLY
jgi:hypothetical protein